jgi:ribonuclease PH
MRHDGRSSIQMRPVKITPGFTSNAEASVMIECGNTKVLCTVCVDEKLPGWMRDQRGKSGWVTAEYSMLPGATHTRSRRERSSVSGRTQEIQRLIGRSVRGIVDLSLLPDLTLTIDCDVLQADGGTRTTSITGAYVALKMAVDSLIRKGKLKQSPIVEPLAAVSVGVKEDQILVDLDYIEDSSADLDMNVVLTSSGKILEIQGTAERQAFTKEQVVTIIDTATDALAPIFELQQQACEGEVVES